MSAYILAVDQGTTGTRAVVYDERGRNCGSAVREFTQSYPHPGWVEHDAEEILATVATVIPEALERAKIKAEEITAIGITNQRETIVAWERSTGRPAAPAIVWQDRRTADFCARFAGEAPRLREKTGLILDPYFSATKLHWLFTNRPELRSAAEAGRLVVGTVDSFLLARLTGNRVHRTDTTNASRTLLFNIHTLQWDAELCAFFAVPQACLPEVLPSAADFGTTLGLDFLPDGVPILGLAGDQQAALFGQGGFARGEGKCTYGTGAFYLLHTGNTPTTSRNRLLTTVAAMPDRTPQYALEGAVFIAGAAIQWLRDGLQILSSSAASEALAERSNPREPILFVPAFVGLGAPHWVPEANGAIFGITRSTTQADIARAALEGVAYQVADLFAAASADLECAPKALRVDGGMCRNEWFLRRQADILGVSILRAPEVESTALGAAFLAGRRAGLWPDDAALRHLLAEANAFVPRWSDGEREAALRRWRNAVAAVQMLGLAQRREAGEP